MKRYLSGAALSVVLICSARVQAQTQVPAGTQGDPAAVPAATPTDNAPSPPETGDIIVTAQKRSESINRVPLTITAASGDQLRAAGVVNTADLTKVVSGFQATQSQIGTPIFYLRGVGFSDISVGSRPAVTIYQDEAPLPYSVMSMGTSLDLERVEVLKGPQGLLFGSNSTGGAINFIAAKPTDTLKVGFDGSFGRFNQYSLSGFVSGPITDTLSFRVAAEHDGGDPWQYDFSNPSRTIGRRDKTSARAIIDFHPDEHLHIALTAQYDVDKGDPQVPQFYVPDFATIQPVTLAKVLALPPVPQNDRAAGWNEPGPIGQPFRRNNNQYQFIGWLDYTFSDDLRLTSLTNYARNHQQYSQDADGTPIQITSFGTTGDIEAFTQELRLAGNVGSRLNFIAGGNYERDKVSELTHYDISGQQSGLAVTALGLPAIDDSIVKAQDRYTSYAGFGNVDFKITDQLTAHGGVRYTYTNTDHNGCAAAGSTPGGQSLPTLLRFIGFVFPNATTAPGECITADDIDGSMKTGLFVDSISERNVSWKGGLDYRITPGTMLYGSASRGYKAGTFSNIGAVRQSALLPVKEERLTAYEVGAKSDIIPGLLHVNAAAFYYDYANKQLQGSILDPVFGVIQKLVSIPQSRVQGGEFELTLRPAHGFALGGSVTYVDSKVTSTFVNFTRFGVQRDFNGSSFPDTPKWQAGGNAEYRAAVSDKLDVYVGGNLTYRSKAYGDFFADERLAEKAYTVTDARVGVESQDHSWLAEIYGRNIFDTYYYPSALRTGDTVYRFTGMPATYGIRVSFRY